MRATEKTAVPQAAKEGGEGFAAAGAAAEHPASR